MADETGIAWTDSTMNPWIGCTKVSEGCRNCYAEESTPARVSKARGLPLWGPTAHRQRTSVTNWRRPLRWNHEAMVARVRRKVFCASLADVFEDREDLDKLRGDLFDIVAVTPWLDWQILTKRPERVLALLHRSLPYTSGLSGRPMVERWLDGTPPDNVWLGTTVESMAVASRIDVLRSIPAAVRFLSCEPLLGALDLAPHLWPVCESWPADLSYEQADEAKLIKQSRQALISSELAESLIDWVIVGGESGPDARPCDERWIVHTVNQCLASGTPVFAKQLGSNYVVDGNRVRTAHSKGADPSEFPFSFAGLQQFPQRRR